jgi:DNA polymerase (family 10)
MVTAIVARTSGGVRVATERGQLDLYVATPDASAAALVWHTGSRKHVASLEARAARAGLSFGQGGLRDAHGTLVPVADEHELYRLLGLPYIPPELREGTGEIDVAERGLPALLDVGQIRGDLHMHSTWSDGRDSILHMVRGAQRLGYEYVAITDHSERARASRRLLALEIPLQREDIEAVRQRVPGIEILHGVEVDILPDGSLDFSDEQLAGFDIVLASLHEDNADSGTRLTERYLAAMSNPFVNVITHPAGRTPALSDGYDLDFDRLFRAAVDTGTAMEVDGSPNHLDMDGDLARRAAAAGVTLTVDSDSHFAEALGRQMSFGVGTARRGWVGPELVLNTRDIGAVRDFITQKRPR